MLQEWDSESASSGEALEKIHTGSYEVIIVGQSVPGGMAIEIISGAKALKPPAEVIAIRFPGDEADLGAETHITDLSSNPGWLRDRVAFLLAKRSASLRD